ADAGPQAAVLELPPLRLRPAKGPLPVPGPGPGATNVRLLGAAADRSGPVDATTVNPTGWRMRQCPKRIRPGRRKSLIPNHNNLEVRGAPQRTKPAPLSAPREGDDLAPPRRSNGHAASRPLTEGSE